jgi:hypothetical protein
MILLAISSAGEGSSGIAESYYRDKSTRRFGRADKYGRKATRPFVPLPRLLTAHGGVDQPHPPSHPTTPSTLEPAAASPAPFGGGGARLCGEASRCVQFELSLVEFGRIVGERSSSASVDGSSRGHSRSIRAAWDPAVAVYADWGSRGRGWCDRIQAHGCFGSS